MKLIRTGEVRGHKARAGAAGGRSVPVLLILMAVTAMAAVLTGRQTRKTGTDVCAGISVEQEAGAEAKGALLFAGGELRFDNAPVWSRFVQLAGGKDAPVVVMPTAADNPTKSGQATVENLVRYGARAEMVLIAPMLKDVDYHDAAKDKANVEKLRRARGIWFIGGEQQRITQALLDEKGHNTPALEAIWD